MPTARESVQRIGQSNRFLFKWVFGGGLSSTADPLDIDLREDARGQNYVLRLDQDSFRSRSAFDLVGTAPNAEPIRGFVDFEDSAGTVTNLVQAGGIVYSIDSTNNFTQVGTVDANAELRGGRESTSLVDDKVLISDLALKENILEWDGTTLQAFATDLTEFKAKYISIVNERAFYANVADSSGTYPHILLVSGRFSSISASALGTLTTANRPATGNTAGDPVFIPTPDLRPLNGLVRAFGLLLLPTDGGQIWKLAGGDATDFSIDNLHRGVFPSGDEAIVNLGNDVIFGRPGRIDTVAGTDRFGDVSTDDVSRQIATDIEDVKGWIAVWNPRTERAYFWPDDGSSLYAFFRQIYRGFGTNLLGAEVKGLSPWSEWKTAFGNADFRPTAAKLMRRSSDGLDVIYFGDASGRVFNLEGTGLQDGGTANVTTNRTSGIIELPFSEIANIRGRVKYRKRFSATLTLTAQFSGTTVKDNAITITLPAISGVPVYGGGFYYTNDTYYGAQFGGRINLQPFQIPGGSSVFQLKAEIAGAEFDIPEIEIEFEGVPA